MSDITNRIDDEYDVDDWEHGEEDELRTEHWCAGLKFSSTRPLDSEEREAIGDQIQRLAHRMGIAIACALIALTVPIAALYLLPTTLGAKWLDISVAVALGAAALGVPVLFVLHARRAWRERRGLHADLGAGEVDRFEGTLEADHALDEEQKDLLTLGALAPKPGAPQYLDVLPTSGTVVVRTLSGPWKFVHVTIAEVAAGPEYAMRVALPRTTAWLEGAPHAQFMRRTLNPHECAEIDAHIRHLRRPGLMVALWATWLTVWAVAYVFSPQGVIEYVQTRWPLVLVQIVVLAGVVFTYARSLHLAARLERDTRTGWALTLDRMLVDPNDHASSETVVKPDPVRSVEFLPHSMAVWSEQGRPARWRNLRRAA